MVWQEIVEALTDDFISVAVTVAILAMAVSQIVAPEWLVLAFGMIIAFYFKK